MDQLGFRLYLITDRAASTRPPLEVVEECLGAGGIGFYLQTYLRMIDYPAASAVLPDGASWISAANHEAGFPHIHG